MSDTLQRFLFERLGVRGELVQLAQSWRTVLERRDYPPVIRRVLGEAMAAAGLLYATIKFDGQLTLQLQGGNGLLHLLLVQCQADGTLRGLARWHGEPAPAPLAQLCGGGTLVLTLESAKGERYQGLVAIHGNNLAGALEEYFDRSEQLPTRLWLAADGERAGGLLLQRLPGQSRGDADGWNRIGMLAATLSEAELLGLDSGTLLRRLFHEEDLRLFEPQSLRFRCTCSRERIEAVLRSLGGQELRALLSERGKVGVDCEFCGQHYGFDAVDVEALLAAPGQPEVPTTRH
ncbi:MAG TPA: Hsp33 family molecular chaperone HslO [Candidatus Competibacteraceae bacterium]|nr:Hsp33 family molecular chaperone HslO [Candidatus Competibacteraceae bacterium]